MLARVLAPGDEPALAEFRCSTGQWFEAEAEDFIRVGLMRRVAEGSATAIVFEDDDERLVAVGAHEPGFLISEGRERIKVAHLTVLALHVDVQGARLEGGQRLSDCCLRTLVAHAQRFHGTAVIQAICARENYRSLRLCERSGLVSQTAIGLDYVRLWGTFVQP